MYLLTLLHTCFEYVSPRSLIRLRFLITTLLSGLGVRLMYAPIELEIIGN